MKNKREKSRKKKFRKELITIIKNIEKTAIYFEINEV